MKKYLAEHHIQFYIINATKIAQEIGLGSRTNTIMQSAFFKVSGVIPYEHAVDEMKKFIVKSYGNKGEEIVNMNFAAVDKGGEVTRVEVPAVWKSIEVKEKKDTREIPDFIRNVVEPVNSLKGDDLPVSAFSGREDGTFPAGTAQYEKRGVAVDVPEWIPENCIQCNQCAYVCPHAAIRAFLLTDEEEKNAPEGTKTIPGIGGIKGYHYKIQVSVLDCTGCGVCVDVCPSKEKSLVMKPLGSQLDEMDKWNYMHETVGYKDNVVPKDKTVKNSQFARPLFEFSGACAGCGETPYIKNLTQLFGDRMIIANATGCSSIYGGSAPSTPYCANEKGHGPAWANSLFEDNAEYGFGMATGIKQIRERIREKMEASLDKFSSQTAEACREWIEGMNEAVPSEEASAKVIPLLEKEKTPATKELLDLKQYFIKKSVWVIGGDGWAYDIGYGGLDHVLASGEDINVLVLDTEVYSNTGGQSSKATPTGAVAKFAASGKKIRKKDLGAMAMTYGYVYIAQVAMGASQSQFFKAMKEAEAYHGPSLIIAYSPCINHGLRRGMAKSQDQERFAVQSGFWNIYRYNPTMEAEGKNPFIYDGKEPQWEKFSEFLNSEVRFTSLKKSFPKEAEVLFKTAEKDAKWRNEYYRRLAAMDYSKNE